MSSTNPNDQLDAEKAKRAVSKKQTGGSQPVRDCRDAPSNQAQDTEKHPGTVPAEPRRPKDHRLRRSQL